MKTKKTCAYPGCKEHAITLASSRACDETIARYCEKHADAVAGHFDPEYIVSCPHCGCRFGVN